MHCYQCVTKLAVLITEWRAAGCARLVAHKALIEGLITLACTLLSEILHNCSHLPHSVS
jgi:hypothetical protein